MAGATSRNIIDGDLVVRQRLTCGAISIPADSIGNDQVKTDDPIECAKLEHQYNATYVSGDSTVAVADATRVVFVAASPGEVQLIRAGVVDPCIGDSTITVDLYKNGASILSSIITLDEDFAAYEQSEGTMDTDASYDSGDVFEIVINATVGTGTLGKGLFAQIIFREGAE